MARKKATTRKPARSTAQRTTKSVYRRRVQKPEAWAMIPYVPPKLSLWEKIKSLAAGVYWWVYTKLEDLWAWLKQG